MPTRCGTYTDAQYGFAANMNVVIMTMDNAAIDVGKWRSYSSSLQWSSFGSQESTSTWGKGLLDGGILIGLFIEFVLPVLISVHY